MDRQKFQTSFNRAVYAFTMYIGAFLGPIFLVSGLDPEFRKNLIGGVLLIGYLIYGLAKKYRYRNTVLKSEKIAFIIIPLSIFPVGLLFALAGAIE